MSQKEIEIISKSTPANPQLGYGDTVIVRVDGKEVYHGSISTCPNPFRPSDKVPYNRAYAWISPGELEWRYAYNPKFGRCLLINNGGKVSCRYNNPNKKSNCFGTPYASEIFIHKGGIGSKNKNWRGSMACITKHPDEFDDFISLFKPGDIGKLIIREQKQAYAKSNEVENPVEVVAKDYKVPNTHSTFTLPSEEDRVKVKEVLDKLPGNGWKTIVGVGILFFVFLFEKFVGDVPGVSAPADMRSTIEIAVNALGGILAAVGVLHKALKH